MIELRENVPLAPLTTFRIGGRARYFSEVRSTDELLEALEWASSRNVPLFILGGGSNLVISDRGFDGLVVKIELRGVERDASGEGVRVTAAAGEEWDAFVASCVRADLAGVECLSGIPGCVGATPIQNVGAYGQEVAESIVHVDVIDRRDRTSRRLSASDCHFGYRSSLFKNEEPERFIVTAVTYRLIAGGAAALRYPELEREVREQYGPSPSLQNVRDGVLTIRRRKGMVLDERDPDTRSAGSFFMNPLLSQEEFAQFEQLARSAIGAEAKVPRFPAAEGRVKTSAAWLIEHAGFGKGYGSGNAGISSKHTLALVNRGGASASELVALRDEIQAGVKNRFGIELHPEPNFIGQF